jgi:hypothetical protein
MKIRDITPPDDKFLDLVETASGGASSAGSVASVAMPLGNIQRRLSLFGYIPEEEPKPTKRVSKRRKAK